MSMARSPCAGIPKGVAPQLLAQVKQKTYKTFTSIYAGSRSFMFENVLNVSDNYCR